MTPETILELACKYRKLMDDLDRRKCGVQFSSFPRGSCGAAAEMFGTYLFERYSVNAQYVSSTHTDGFEPHGSHAWLELDDLIIDLTCDQFSHDPLPAPYVGKDRSWHSQWAVEHKTDMEVWLECNRALMFSTWGEAYKDLLEQLNRLPSSTRK